jgi:hypothetical protein
MLMVSTGYPVYAPRVVAVACWTDVAISAPSCDVSAPAFAPTAYPYLYLARLYLLDTAKQGRQVGV